LKALDQVPVGLTQLIRTYGNPDADGDGNIDLGWLQAELITVSLPFAMRCSWQPFAPVRRIQVHRLVADSMMDALIEIEQHAGAQVLADDGLDMYGGCFAWRLARGSPYRSTHCWGIAIDLNPALAPWGKPSNQPKFIVDAFMKRGWTWGGSWKVPDGMHFQAVVGY